MSDHYDFSHLQDDPMPGDRFEEDAYEALEAFFSENRRRVFFSRQLEVQNEGQWFHWITNRALRELVERGVIRAEDRSFADGAGHVRTMWHRTHRYPRRDADRVVQIVERYAHPQVASAVGYHGESMVARGFARQRFVLLGEEVRHYEDREWTASGHDLDFIFERDGVAYGVEVKNTLGYLPRQEFVAKISMCRHLGIRPVFAVRMLPKNWIHDLNRAGGFALIFKWQLYPPSLRELAHEVQSELGLPVDTPRALADGTMERFVRWHERHT
jgi:hypothetical protein